MCVCVSGGRCLLLSQVPPAIGIVWVSFVPLPRADFLAACLWIGGASAASSQSAACHRTTRGTLSASWQMHCGDGGSRIADRHHSQNQHVTLIKSCAVLLATMALVMIKVSRADEALEMTDGGLSGGWGGAQ